MSGASRPALDPLQAALGETDILPASVLLLLRRIRRKMREVDRGGTDPSGKRDPWTLVVLVVGVGLSFAWTCALALGGYRLLLWAVGE